MKLEIKIPTVGESITEAIISEWQKSSGDFVEQNDVLLVLETDKASVEVVAEKAGKLDVLTPADETVAIGAVVGTIDTSAAPSASAKSADTEKNSSSKAESSTSTSTPPATPSRTSPMADTLSPATRRVVEENHLDASKISGTGPHGRITKDDAQKAAQSGSVSQAKTSESSVAKSTPTPTVRTFTARDSRREKMSNIRKRIAERLVQAQQTAAILTTFNEVDMTAVMELRSKYKDAFEKKYGIRLGFMGFFVKAAVAALRDFPAVNAYIDGEEFIYNDFVNMGIAVGGPRGLVVPVIKDADLLSIAEIEAQVKNFGQKAQSNKLTIDELNGGTFTISNGGVYGSLMSTPILNPPQSAILGMHKIEERPVVIDGEIQIRPMMYLALSYDHRIIDGKESVSFLVKIKEALEDPSRLVLEI
ncbi:MAG: 2-oxoglutarate dehydrogenase complex dihydrolipoyllysine-residue succinyltransferase [Bdellovibrionaceae bacterium]|nr:2-oxoglutarate dehydrogenase complex dihydrolipoyllysine-residue succinyltransferase [Pseudobdellovibrionaceae bacterium]